LRNADLDNSTRDTRQHSEDNKGESPDNIPRKLTLNGLKIYRENSPWNDGQKIHKSPWRTRQHSDKIHRESPDSTATEIQRDAWGNEYI